MKQEKMTITDMYDYLLEHDIATSKEINLVTHINGYNRQAMIDIIEVRTGFDFDQYQELVVEENEVLDTPSIADMLDKQARDRKQEEIDILIEEDDEVC